LQVQTRLAELDPAALELADAEALADEIVESHAARQHVPARRGAVELDPVLGLEGLERLGLDQRQLPVGAVALVLVAVADEPLAGHGVDGLDRMRQLAALGGDEDRLDPPFAHGSIISGVKDAMESSTTSAA